MTREEAARILEKQFDKSCGNYRYQNNDKLDYEDALWMAISSLRPKVVSLIVLAIIKTEIITRITTSTREMMEMTLRTVTNPSAISR